MDKSLLFPQRQSRNISRVMAFRGKGEREQEEEGDEEEGETEADGKCVRKARRLRRSRVKEDLAETRAFLLDCSNGSI